LQLQSRLFFEGNLQQLTGVFKAAVPGVLKVPWAELCPPVDAVGVAAHHGAIG